MATASERNPVPDPSRRRMVTGLFRDRDSAERAYRSVSGRGYSGNAINVVMSDDTRKRYFTDRGALDTELGSKAAEGAGAGAAIGGTVERSRPQSPR